MIEAFRIEYPNTAAPSTTLGVTVSFFSWQELTEIAYAITMAELDFEYLRKLDEALGDGSSTIVVVLPMAFVLFNCIPFMGGVGRDRWTSPGP
jgi:ABC-type microcin C transport system permease subunit YejE